MIVVQQFECFALLKMIILWFNNFITPGGRLATKLSESITQVCTINTDRKVCQKITQVIIIPCRMHLI